MESHPFYKHLYVLHNGLIFIHYVIIIKILLVFVIYGKEAIHYYCSTVVLSCDLVISYSCDINIVNTT